MVTWGERPYPGLCPSAVVELVKVDIDVYIIGNYFFFEIVALCGLVV